MENNVGFITKKKSMIKISDRGKGVEASSALTFLWA